MQTVDGVFDIILRLGAAVVCGAVLGWEREQQDKPAGLRTHMMVALGAASFTIVTVMVAVGHDRFDPLRVVSGVIGGIGFLGAGAIIQARGAVRGITTAAGVWVVGAIGVACGLGHYTVAVPTTVFAVIILGVIGYIEQRLLKTRREAKAPKPKSDDNETAGDE